MLDIRWIRNNPDALDAGLKARGEKPCAQTLLALDQKVRKTLGEVEEIRHTRNAHAKKMGAASKGGRPDATLLKEGATLRTQLEIQEKTLHALQSELRDLMHQLPNMPEKGVAFSKNGEGTCVRTWGEKTTFDFNPKPHEVIGDALGLSTEKGVALSGTRFVVLEGFAARLERALAHLMLDLHTKKFGYKEVSPPYLVKEDAVFNVGQLPKFRDDAFQTTDGRWLISTSEVALTNLGAKKTFQASDLPKLYTAYTPCFRSEAGSAGRDMHGMIRLHQFSKVELVALTTKEKAPETLEAMVSHAEAVLQLLQLPYRVVLLAANDMGFSAQKTYDLEVWFPAQNTYREISSCSLCGDFQARRMKGQYILDDGTKDFLYTLNGSGVAVGRCLAAVLENGQQKDGSVVLPPVLEKYMTGFDEHL